MHDDIEDIRRKAFLKSKSKRKTNKFVHTCALPPTEDLIVNFINAGRFVYLRRKLKKYFTINENSKYAKECFKSSKQMEMEMRRHLKHYYYMIHPFSRVSDHFNIVLFVFLMFSVLTFRLTTNVLIIVILDTVFMLEVVRGFATGVYREEYNDTIMEPRKVIKMYVKGGFAHDFLNAMPVRKMVDIDPTSQPTLFAIFGGLATVLQIIRMMKIARVIATIQKHRQFNIYLYRGIRLLMIAFLLILWLSYALLLLMEANLEEWYSTTNLNSFIVVVERNFNFFFLIGSKYAKSINPFTMLWETFIMMIGYFFNIYATVQFYHFTKLYNASLNLTQAIHGQLGIYSKSRRLPTALDHRVRLYYDFRFPQSFFDEEFIRATSSRHLHKRIAECQSQGFLVKVQVFHDVPLAYLTQIMLAMKMSTHLPNDIISQSGNKTRCLHAIFYGTAAMYSNHWKELCHLYDCDYFGDGFLDAIDAAVVAVDCCKTYYIAMSDLRAILEPMPEHYDDIVHLVEDEALANYRKYSQKETGSLLSE